MRYLPLLAISASCLVTTALSAPIEEAPAQVASSSSSTQVPTGSPPNPPTDNVPQENFLEPTESQYKQLVTDLFKKIETKNPDALRTLRAMHLETDDAVVAFKLAICNHYPEVGRELLSNTSESDLQMLWDAAEDAVKNSEDDDELDQRSETVAEIAIPYFSEPTPKAKNVSSRPPRSPIKKGDTMDLLKKIQTNDPVALEMLKERPFDLDEYAFGMTVATRNDYPEVVYELWTKAEKAGAVIDLKYLENYTKLSKLHFSRVPTKRVSGESSKVPTENVSEQSPNVPTRKFSEKTKESQFDEDTKKFFDKIKIRDPNTLEALRKRPFELDEAVLGMKLAIWNSYPEFGCELLKMAKKEDEEKAKMDAKRKEKGKAKLEDVEKGEKEDEHDHSQRRIWEAADEAVEAVKHKKQEDQDKYLEMVTQIALLFLEIQ